MLKLYVPAKFNRGVKNRRLPDFVETIRISQITIETQTGLYCYLPSAF